VTARSAGRGREERENRRRGEGTTRYRGGHWAQFIWSSATCGKENKVGRAKKEPSRCWGGKRKRMGDNLLGKRAAAVEVNLEKGLHREQGLRI